MDTIKNNSKSNSKTTSRLRRFAIGTVAAVAGLGLAGAGTAAAATPTADAAPAVETEAEQNVKYEIGAGSWVYVNDFYAGTVSGGYILDDHTGVIEVDGGEDIVITGGYIGFGMGFLNADYAGLKLMGELEMIGLNLYELAFEDFSGNLEVEIPFLVMTEVS